MIEPTPTSRAADLTDAQVADALRYAEVRCRSAHPDRWTTVIEQRVACLSCKEAAVREVRADAGLLREQEPVTCTAYYTDGPHNSEACGLPADHWPAPHSWEAIKQEPAQGVLTEVTTESRVAVMDPWCDIARAHGWEVDADPTYWAAVDGLAWSLIEQTMDTADREPSRETLRDARATAERALAARGGTAAAGDEGLRERMARVVGDLCAFDIEDCPVPDDVDVPDDYERGINDAGLKVYAALDAAPAPTEGAASYCSPERRAEGWRCAAPCAGPACIPATPAPTEDPAPAQDTLRAAVEADLSTAIARVEESRQTHVEWLAYWREYEAHACSTDPCPWEIARKEQEEIAGDIAHQERAIEGYDAVLRVLAALAATTPEATGRDGGGEG